MTKFSFIIPVYNCKNTLIQCVDSIQSIASDWAKFEIEIILVDDGSTDGSGEVCDSFCSRQIDYIKFNTYHQKNKGVSAARNKGLLLATGDYVIFIDSDDTIESDKMRELLQAVCSDPLIDLAVYGICFDYYLRNKCYRRDEILPALSGKLNKEIWRGEMFELYRTNVLSPLWNKVIRKELLKSNKLLLDENMIVLEDLEFSLRCMKYCDQILFYQESVYHYNHFGHNDHAGKRLKRITHLGEVIQKIEDALQPYSGNSSDEDIRKILISNYQNLLSAKIAVVGINDITFACKEFKSWIDEKHFLSEIHTAEYMNKSSLLFLRSRKMKVRHYIANLVKYTIGDFRKWKR